MTRFATFTSSHMPDRVSADVVIIGSGPGGAITGLCLAQNGIDVMLLEEGNYIGTEETRALSPDEMQRKLRNSGLTMGLGTSPMAFWEARCLGGGSEVNRGLYHRPSDPVIDAWGAEIDAFSPEELAPLVDQNEAIVKVSALPGPAPAVSQRLADGAMAKGWHQMEVPRLFSYNEDWEAGPRPGCKQSMSNTVLPQFAALGGRIVTGMRVSRMSRKDGGWRLLAHPHGTGERRRVEINAQSVFIACGATQTPALLRRSGFRKGAGDTLRYHSMIKVVARFDEVVGGGSRLDPVHQVKQFDPAFSLGASISTPATTVFALSDRFDVWSEIRDKNRHLGVYYAQTTGGRGRVRVLPGFQDPWITIETVPQDLRDLATGLKTLCEALFAAGAVEIYPNIAGSPNLTGPQDIDALPDQLDPKTVSISSLHMLASCRMGKDPRRAADSFGKVRGADGLYLADSSMLPGATVVNPQGTIMAVARRNAQHFLENQAKVRHKRAAIAH